MGNDGRPNYGTSHWFSLFVNKSSNGFQIKNEGAAGSSLTSVIVLCP